MTQHTPGPWRIGEYRTGISDSWREGESLYERSIYSADQIKIAVCDQWIGDKESAEAKANAALIAAAPELLAALERMTGEFLMQIQFSVEGGNAEKFHACLAQARAAIRAAKGE